jgi:hypothetical protein
MRRVLFFLSIVAGLVFVMFVKFNGVVYFSLPPLVALFSAPFFSRRWWRQFLLALLAVLLAMLLIAPYYYFRNFKEAGTIFPNNADIFTASEQKMARKERDRDPVQFFTTLLFTTDGVFLGNTHSQNTEPPRLSQAWYDLWMRRTWLGGGAYNGPPLVGWLGRFYAAISPAFVILGLFTFFWFRRKWNDPWYRFGWVLLLFSILEVLALIYYVYQNPYGHGVPTKAIYIIPATLTLGYFLTFAADEGASLLPQSWRPSQEHMNILALTLLLLILIINSALPIY